MKTTVALSAIVAMTPEGIIGRKGKLPWHLPHDLQRFKAITTEIGIVIMGRKTYEEILERNQGPLPGRHHVVISRSGKMTGKHFDGIVTIVASPQEALESIESRGGTRACVTGGAQTYAELLPFIDTVDVTLVHGVRLRAGDAYFPRLPDVDWEVIEQTLENHFQGDEYPTSHMLLQRRVSEEWQD